MKPDEITIPYERCNKQGKIFAIANRLGYDLEGYVVRYLSSELATSGKDDDYRELCELARLYVDWAEVYPSKRPVDRTAAKLRKDEKEKNRYGGVEQPCKPGNIPPSVVIHERSDNGDDNSDANVASLALERTISPSATRAATTRAKANSADLRTSCYCCCASGGSFRIWPATSLSFSPRLLSSRTAAAVTPKRIEMSVRSSPSWTV